MIKTSIAYGGGYWRDDVYRLWFYYLVIVAGAGG